MAYTKFLHQAVLIYKSVSMILFPGKIVRLKVLAIKIYFNNNFKIPGYSGNYRKHETIEIMHLDITYCMKATKATKLSNFLKLNTLALKKSAHKHTHVNTNMYSHLFT